MSAPYLRGSGPGEEVARAVLAGRSPGGDEVAAFWAAVWDEIAPGIDARPVPYVADLIDYAAITPDARVLDIGTGTGHCALAASQRTTSKGSVTAIDISPEMLRLAEAKLGAEKIAFRVMDAQELDFPDESFDVVLSSMMLMTVPEPEKLFRSVYRVLKYRGRFVLSTLVLRADARQSMVEFLLQKLPPGLFDGIKLVDSDARVAALRGVGFDDIRVAHTEYPRQALDTLEVEATTPMLDFLRCLAQAWTFPAVSDDSPTESLPDMAAVEFTSAGKLT
jgi:SAM-dependent methyltransferase